jgi:hypothetical protein
VFKENGDEKKHVTKNGDEKKHVTKNIVNPYSAAVFDSGFVYHCFST